MIKRETRTTPKCFARFTRDLNSPCLSITLCSVDTPCTIDEGRMRLSRLGGLVYVWPRSQCDDVGTLDDLEHQNIEVLLTCGPGPALRGVLWSPIDRGPWTTGNNVAPTMIQRSDQEHCRFTQTQRTYSMLAVSDTQRHWVMTALLAFSKTTSQRLSRGGI